MANGDHAAGPPVHAPPSSERPAGDLSARVASALVLAPLAIAAAYVGGWLFIGFWTLAAAAILWEWTGFAAAAERRSILLVGVPALAMAAGLAAYGRLFASFIVLLVGAGAVGVLAARSQRTWVAGGFLYAGAALWAPAVLRNDPRFGFTAIIFLFAVVWATDALGYFVGRAIGGPKLWPSVSPNKTWSGAIGGAAAAVAVSIVLASFTTATNWPTIGVIA